MAESTPTLNTDGTESAAVSLLGALRAAHEALDEVSVLDRFGRVAGWAPVTELSPEELAEAVRLGAALEGRVAGLRLQCVAAAEVTGAVEASAAADAGAWAARAGRNRSRSWGQAWLAAALEESYPATRAALAQGRIGEDHAAVIAKTLGRVPDHVREALSAGDWAGCEEQLVVKAERMAPGNLRKAARRFLDPICARLADEHEEAALRAEEDRAEAQTWLSLGDNGDGTWTGKFTVPALHGAMLKKTLDGACQIFCVRDRSI